MSKDIKEWFLRLMARHGRKPKTEEETRDIIDAEVQDAIHIDMARERSLTKRARKKPLR